MKKSWVAGAAVCLALSGANAAQIPTTVSASGTAFAGDLSVLNDGFLPINTSSYSGSYAVHDFGATSFTFDFGGLTEITDFLASVDNNDDYDIAFFDGSTQAGSIHIDALLGGAPTGLDTFSSLTYPGATQIDPGAVFLATKAVITASGGDKAYSLAELDFFDNPKAVTPTIPEPASWVMMLLGFGAMGGALRMRRAPATGLL